MSDDLARSLPPTTEPGPVSLDEPEPAQAPFAQITEIEAAPTDAADAIERRDAWGRVPVVVRIRRQPPIRVEAILIAVALGASGLLLPLFLALRAVIIVAAVIAVVVGFLARLFIRVPPGAVGLTVVAGRQDRVLPAGIHRVKPLVTLTHLVTTREIAFDVPVTEVRSADGVAVTVDLVLTLTVADPVVFAYQVATGDADMLVHAATQDAVRATLRTIDALAALDLGAAEADALRGTIDAGLARFGLAVHAVAFTRITLPAAFTDSLEARRLSAIRIAEQAEAFALEQRRLADRGALAAQEAEVRRLALEADAAAEAVRLARLAERLEAHPDAARYDLDVARLRVAKRLAGNSRAVVSLGGSGLLGDLLASAEAAPAPADPERSNGSSPKPAGSTPPA